ncbi:MAG: peptidoglycan DD-metalloendopeptidase family protein [Buchnera aphidicola (Schlechtendalia peitan)]
MSNLNCKIKIKDFYDYKELKKNIFLKNVIVNVNSSKFLCSIKWYILNFFNNHILLSTFTRDHLTNPILNQLYISDTFLYKNTFFKKFLIRNTEKMFNGVLVHYSKTCCKYLSVKGVLNDDFLKNSKNYGLDVNEIKNVINIITHQINFYKLSIKSPFSILIKQNVFDRKVYKNKIVGLKIYNNDLNYYGILANDGKFYDIKGFSLTETFLKFPSLKKYRISSAFNPHRLNPITKKISPHQGIDLAMPIGTPILSIGNGEIIKIQSSLAAGKYIAIKHSRKYITKYMHLKKILVKIGEKVKKGDKIGLSGNTGYSTGPHLHYEVWLKNKVVNPEKIIILERLSGKNLKIYLKSSHKIANYLENI